MEPYRKLTRSQLVAACREWLSGTILGDYSAEDMARELLIHLALQGFKDAE